MTPRAESLILHAMGDPARADALADLAVLLLAPDGDVTPAEVRGALERSLTGMLDARERAWPATRGRR